MPDKEIKVYVQVRASFSATGEMQPLSLFWEDGQQYVIDRVLAVNPAPAQRAGGQGDRYTVQINGKQSYLYFEHNPTYGTAVLGRWFVQRKS